MNQTALKMIRIFILSLLMSASLSAQMLILSPEENAVSNLHHIAITAMGKPSAEAKLFINNKYVSTEQIRSDGICDFINVKVPDGPVTLRVEAMGALDRLYAAEKTIHIIGSPRSVLPYEKNTDLPADGRSRRRIKFKIRDEWGYTVNYLKIATVKLDHGTVISPDIDSLSKGIQVPVTDGAVEIVIQSPEVVKKAYLEIDLKGISLEYPIHYHAPRIPFMLVGSLNGGASNYHPFIHLNEGEPEAEIWRQQSADFFDLPFLFGGRAAFYAKGQIAESVGVTLSYDSKRNYRDEFYRDLDPNDQYAIYGDASKLTYDAQSRSPLFLKLEKDQTSLIYGDFNTDMTQTEYTAYNRTLNGLVLNHGGQSHQVKAFITKTDHDMTMDEIRGQGISGYYYLTENNISELSEKIQIQTRDRYHSEEIIKSVEKVRYQDYTINYDEGTIMFKQPVPAMDNFGNPIYIVVSYEHKSGERKNFSGGVRYQGTFFKKLKLGVTGIAEQKDSTAYLLYGADMLYPVFNGVSLKAEFAGSVDPRADQDRRLGNAYKAELKIKPHEIVNINAYYRHLDSSFVNKSLSGKLTETGSTKYGAKAAVGNTQLGLFSSEYYYQLRKTGTLNENKSRVFNLDYKRSIGEKSDVMVAFEDARKEKYVNSDSTSSLVSDIVRAKFNYRIIKKLTGFIERDQNLTAGNQSKPTFTGIGLTYSLTEKIGVSAKYKRIEGDSPGNQFVFGIDSRVGHNTKVNGKYEIGGASGNHLNRASIGLQNKWAVTDELMLNLSYENILSSDEFEVPVTEHQALSVSYEYLPEINLKTTGKYEFHIKKDTRTNNAVLNLNVKVFHGLSMLMKSVYSRVDYQSEGGDYGEEKHIKSDNQIGIAFRPEQADSYNALAKAAYIINKNTHVDPGVNNQRFIFSMHNHFQPIKKLEIGLKLARRFIVDEGIPAYTDYSTTDYCALRLEYDMSLRWYAAADASCLRLLETDEIKFGSSVEVGYLLTHNMQLGLGYALSSYEDVDFQNNSYRFHNFFLTLHMKFSEDLLNW